MCMEKRIQKYALDEPELNELFQRTKEYMQLAHPAFPVEEASKSCLLKEFEFLLKDRTDIPEKILRDYEVVQKYIIRRGANLR